MKTTRQKRAAPFYAAAAVWLAYALVLPLYEPLHYALAAGASLLAFAAAAALCRGGPVGEEAGKAPPEKAEEPIEKKPASTGNPELDKMVRDGEMAIREMKRLDENIADPGISADIVRLEQVSARIFDEVRTHPEKLPQIRRFLDYYLPTTLKLLNAYDRMSGTGVSGENIDTTLAKVEGMMRTIVAAFEKQLDSLYGAEALDISTDITVLENMMAREGLVDSPLKAEPGGLHNAELLLPLAWLAGAVALGLRLDKACKQAGRWGEAAHHFFSSVIWLLLGIGFMKQAPGIWTLCGVLGVVYAVVYAVCGVRAAGKARRNEENGRE